MENQYHSHTPHWARKIEEAGSRRWRRERKAEARMGEYIGAIIWNIVFLWILNNLTSWHLAFITDRFGAVQWILMVNCLVQIGGNILMASLRMPVVRYLGRIATESAAFVATMALYFIYPFDFSNYYGLVFLDWLLPILFIIAMVVHAIKVISNAWKLLFWRS
jgi:hypothetical protein